METQELLTIGTSIISLLIAALSFFVGKIFKDVSNLLVESGKNKGRIELVEQQLTNDVKRIEQTTQLELKTMCQKIETLSGNVNELTQNVNALVLTFAKKGIKLD